MPTTAFAQSPVLFAVAFNAIFLYTLSMTAWAGYFSGHYQKSQSPQPDLASQMMARLHDFSEYDRYWSIDDIAAFTGTSKSTIRRNFICDPRWPLPIRTSTAENSKQRWLASEVKKALLLFRRR